MSTPGLFDDFDAADVAAAIASHESDRLTLGQASAVRRRHAVQTRQISSDKKVADLLPKTISPGESWHCLSRGDIDVLSFTRHLLAGAGHFDVLTMSTWRINRDDLEQIERWLDSGLVEIFHLVIDLRFQRLAPDEYELAQRLANQYGGTVHLCLNHSKLTLAETAETETYLVIESSANVNTNHRLEQTAIHNCRQLHDFYNTALHGIRTRRSAAP